MDSRLTIDDMIEMERACGMLHGPFWQHKFLARAPERVRRELALAALRPNVVGMRNDMETPVVQEFPNFSGIAAVTSLTETNLWNPGIWTPIPANDAAPGSGYVLSFGGIYSNRTTSSPTSTFQARWGTDNSVPPTGTALGGSRAVYMGNTTTNKPFFGQLTVVVRSVGATGSCVANGQVRAVRDDGVGTVTTWLLGGTAAVTIDTTVAAGLGVSHIWGAANAANTLTAQWAFLRAFD